MSEESSVSSLFFIFNFIFFTSLRVSPSGNSHPTWSAVVPPRRRAVEDRLCGIVARGVSGLFLGELGMYGSIQLSFIFLPTAGKKLESAAWVSPFSSKGEGFSNVLLLFFFFLFFSGEQSLV